MCLFVFINSLHFRRSLTVELFGCQDYDNDVWISYFECSFTDAVFVNNMVIASSLMWE